MPQFGYLEPQFWTNTRTVQGVSAVGIGHILPGGLECNPLPLHLYVSECGAVDAPSNNRVRGMVVEHALDGHLPAATLQEANLSHAINLPQMTPAISQDEEGGRRRSMQLWGSWIPPRRVL